MASQTAKIVKNVTLRKSNSTKSASLGTLKKGDKCTVTRTKNDSSGNTWAKTDKGWFISYKKSGGKGTSYAVLTNESTSKESDKSLKKLANTLTTSTNNGKKLTKTMQLFGLPYQFLPSVDYRVPEVSDLIGRKYIEKIILQAPVVTILPGKPSYLPGQKDKTSITQAFLEASSGNLGPLQALATDTDVNNLKFYDFKTAYVEAMRYVNVMCRSFAAFLELEGNDKHANKVDYKINGKVANFMNYDWKNYRWNGQKYTSTAGSVLSAGASSAKSAASSVYDKLSSFGSSIINVLSGKQKKNTDSSNGTTLSGDTISNAGTNKNTLDLNDNSSDLTDEETDTMEGLFRNIHYMQFYCDPSSDVSESIDNSTKESSLKSTFTSVSDTMKDIAFMANSGGVDTENLQKLGDKAMDSLGDIVSNGVSSVNETAGSLVSRLLGTGKNIIKGDNVIMPDIYSSSSYTKSYTITIQLKAIYGNKYSIYMDVLVPLSHILSLVLPKATSANTFSAPMLVKCFMPGKFTCNMGIVTSCSITKNQDFRNVDGLCQEMEVQLSITDLYSDLTMTPASDPVLFCNNTSLVEYLAINCGLDLIDSQFTTKASLIWNNLKNSVTDIPDNVVSSITEEMDSLIYKFTGL